MLQKQCMLRKNNRAAGTAGEDTAANYLCSQGYEIISRNFRTRRGEIDIIAHKENVLVFVEVKSLPSGNIETLAQKLNVQKQKRIVETAKCYLSNYRQYSNDYIRFDVIVIDMPEFGPVYHLENAFSEFL